MRQTLGGAIRALREERNISLRKLESLGGPSREAARLYESDAKVPTVAAAQKLLIALGEPLDSEPSHDLLQRVQEARGVVVAGLSPEHQKQLVETVVHLVLAHDPRRLLPAIQLAARLEVERELIRVGIVQRRCL